MHPLPNNHPLPWPSSLSQSQYWAQQTDGLSTQRSYQQQPLSLLHTPAYSSHYAQAYLQSYSIPSSSTVNPTSYNVFPYENTISHQGTVRPLPPGSWFQPGHNRCSYKDCNFTGSPKAVEIHMMDRHLIYPPGWQKQKKNQEWDADPSLKGKPIPVQGTNIILDSPEVLAVWISERKKRFPTSARVGDKKRKLEEALARGQLSIEDVHFSSEKRRKFDNSKNYDGDVRQQVFNQGRGRGRGRGVDSGWGTRGRGSSPSRILGRSKSHARPLPPISRSYNHSDDDGSSSSNDEPEVVTFEKAQLAVESPRPGTVPNMTIPSEGHLHKISDPLQGQKSRVLHPKKRPHNPFASRPTLLRNLLLPEIRVTISNLSQAIRFLVDNDFLRAVEIKPGQANESKIQVLGIDEEPSSSIAIL